MNGKVERLNHELVQHFERISVEENYDQREWDTYLHQALFAYYAYVNSRIGATLFYLQHSTEPVLLSTAISSKLITKVEIMEALEHRRKHIQDFSKYRSDKQD